MVASTETFAFPMEALAHMPDELPELDPGSAITPENIARRRKELKLTQEELGRLTGVSDRAVRSWESGQHEPEGEARARLVGVLGLKMSEPLKASKHVTSPELDLIRAQVKQMQNGLAMIDLMLERVIGPEKK